MGAVGKLTVVLFVLAQGDASADSFAGTLKLPRIELSDSPYGAFARPVANALVPSKTTWPFRNMIVVLEGKVSSATPPARTKYELIGHSFRTKVLPVAEGTVVVCRNLTKESPVLSAGTALKAAPMHPGTNRELTVPSGVETIPIYNKKESRLLGTLVVVSSPFATTVNSRGAFSFRNVPPGNWKVKVWYNGKWLQQEHAVTISGATQRSFRLSSLQ